MSENEKPDAARVHITEEEWQILLQYVESVRYGSVTLHVQDGRIVQIEKSEKFRLK